MSQWQPDMFTQNHMNPSMYNNLAANPNQFDLSASNTPFQPGLQNGNIGNQTPTSGFPNQAFQPGAVVPQKRPHDGMSGSPPPAQVSRSQTPSYGTFPNQQPGQQFPAQPNPYSHLQQTGSAQATPSPTMQSQPFRQPAQQQPSRLGNASPSPFPNQQQGNFGAQMSPAPGQTPASMPQQNQMGGFNPQYGMNQNMGMQGMSGAMGAQGNAMANMNANQVAQRQYQLRLMQQQAQMRQNGGMQPPRTGAGQPNAMYNQAGAQQGGQMPNAQGSGQMPTVAMQQHQMKRATFLKACQQYVMQAGRQFNPTPLIGQKPVDLYNLFSVVISMNGAANVDRSNQWQTVATKLGFLGPGFENAAQEIRAVYANSISAYERVWTQARTAQKQEQARQQAHQMAGFGPSSQASPTKQMPPPSQNQYNQLQQSQQAQPQQPHATPVQANAALAQQNGMSTPQQMMGGVGTIHHRRNSSMVKRETMTPGSGPQGITAPSPTQKVQRSPSVKQEPAGAVMKSDEPQSTNYVPQMRSIEWDGGYDIPALNELGNIIQQRMPNMPTVDEMGVIDTRAITLSLASGIHGEVRYALDALAIISMDQRISFDLEKCDDLIDVLIDCAEEQADLLSEEAAEVSDALDLPSYEDIMRGSKIEADTLQDVPAFGTQAFELDRAADKLVAITTILRNFSFYEHNHRLLTTNTLMKWLSNTIRLLGTRNMLLRTFYNTQDFYKDMVIFLSNITQSLELPSRDDALHILHFLLAFAPQPSPSYTESSGKIVFQSFNPAIHRYLPPAVDCLAKLLARQDPNRVLYKSIFTASSSSLASSESPLDLLTRSFALSISVLPDRSKAATANSSQLRIVEARKAYLTQGMLAADILTTLLPSTDSVLARSWLESEDGWSGSLLSLASLLSVDQPPRAGMPNKGPQQPMGWDVESFRLIAYRSLMMLKRLAEKAGKNAARTLVNGFTDGDAIDEGEDGQHEEPDEEIEKWEGIPLGHAVIGALMLPNCDKTSLGLLCGLHEMAMRDSGT